MTYQFQNLYRVLDLLNSIRHPYRKLTSDSLYNLLNMFKFT